jgi:O-antigen ligase
MATKLVNKKKSSPAINLVFIGSALTTLLFNSRLQDPFNSPKMWVLMLLAGSLIGYVLFFNYRAIRNRYYALVLTLICTFILSCLVSTLASSDRLISLFGESQRRNGFVTYLSLVVIFIALVQYIEFEHFERLTLILGLTSVLLVVYGLMQFYGADFVDWNNPYNRVIGTAGNPNFSGAIFAMLCTFFSVQLLMDIVFKFTLRSILYLVISILLFINILNTNARQGVLSYAVGVAVAFVLIAFIRRRALGLILSALFFTGGFLVVQGVLNSGPLKEYLYKETVSIRGYYWRTGIEMFKANPLTGVGLDNYGGFFNFYREVGFPLKYGFEVMSNNAHNTFIQMFATGGFFVGSSYLLLQIIIAIIALKALKVCKKENQGIMIILFASWITFHAQSLVSIDNVAISIWGWVFGGALIGLSIKVLTGDSTNYMALNPRNEPQKILTSFVAVLFTFIFCSFLYRAETSMYFLRSIYSNQAGQQVDNRLLTSAEKMLELPFLDAEYRAQAGFYLATSGYLEEGIAILDENIDNHPNSINSYNVIANIYESLQKPKKAEPYRLAMIKLNPWNAKNYLQLGKNYKAQQDYTNMEKMLKKIESFASATEVYTQAKNELVSQ